MFYLSQAICYELDPIFLCRTPWLKSQLLILMLFVSVIEEPRFPKRTPRGMDNIDVELLDKLACYEAFVCLSVKGTSVIIIDCELGDMPWRKDARADGAGLSPVTGTGNQATDIPASVPQSRRAASLPSSLYVVPSVIVERTIYTNDDVSKAWQNRWHAKAYSK